MQRQRDYFIDVIKIYACVLVVLGHFVQSMLKALIIPDSMFFEWFLQTIYYFHVPLFFICSGYLFQKYSVVSTFVQWKDNFLKKLIALGVPYLFFSTITWGLKTVFSSSVNDQVQGYFECIFLSPISPYWYLYALVLIFLIIPTFFNKKIMYIILFVAFFLKVITFLPIEINIYAVSIVMQNLIWFVLGMCLCVFNPLQYLKVAHKYTVAILLSAVFVVFSVLIYLYDIESAPVSFLMGLTGCVSTVAFAMIFSDKDTVKSISLSLSKYTMPVFLMHTIFAAGLRALLFKVGVTNGLVHIVSGLVISFIGPVVAIIIMEKIKFLDFVIYPNKYIKINSRGKNNGKKT